MSSQVHAREMETYSYCLFEAISLVPGTFPILTQSSKFYSNICVLFQVHPIEIKSPGFSRIGQGRDGNKEDLARYSA